MPLEHFLQQGALGITTAVPVNAPYNPTRSALFAAFRYTPDVRRADNSAHLRRLVGGFRGKLGERLQWEAGYNTNTNRLENSLSGQYYSPNLQLALAGGYDANGNPQVGGRYARIFRNYNAPPNTTTKPRLTQSMVSTFLPRANIQPICSRVATMTTTVASSSGRRVRRGPGPARCGCPRCSRRRRRHGRANRSASRSTADPLTRRKGT